MRDLLLIPWSDAEGDDRVAPPAGEPLADLGRGLAFARVNPEEAELIVNTCLPRGHYFFPQWQTPFLYAFQRELDPADYSDRFSWDSDGTITVALQLSRLVVDNAYSTEFAVRIVDHDDGEQQIIPHVMHLMRFMPTYRLRNDRDWLTEHDAADLRRLIAAYWENGDELPTRVARALSLSEGVVHSGVLERALVLLMMGIEALLNTHKEKVSKQITTRLPILATAVGVPGVNRRYATLIYAERSQPAHGRELKLPAATASGEEGDAPGPIDDAFLARVAKLQDLLRATVRRAIEDPVFAEIFRNEAAIRGHWPVIVDSVSY